MAMNEYTELILICVLICTWILPYDTRAGGTTTPHNNLIRCPYKCGSDRICDPGTNQCISCRRYCHTRISDECDRKCPRFVSPHNVHHGTQGSSTINPFVLEPYLDTLSTAENGNSTFPLTIWILGSITAFALLSLLIMSTIFMNNRRKQKRSNLLLTKNVNALSQTSQLDLKETKSGDVEFRRSNSVTSVVAQLCTQSSSSISSLLHDRTLHFRSTYSILRQNENRASTANDNDTSSEKSTSTRNRNDTSHEHAATSINENGFFNDTSNEKSTSTRNQNDTSHEHAATSINENGFFNDTSNEKSTSTRNQNDTSHEHATTSINENGIVNDTSSEKSTSTRNRNDTSHEHAATSINESGIVNEFTISTRNENDTFIESARAITDYSLPHTLPDVTDGHKLQRSQSVRDTSKLTWNTPLLRQVKSNTFNHLSSLWRRVTNSTIYHVKPENENKISDKPATGETDLMKTCVRPEHNICSTTIDTMVSQHDNYRRNITDSLHQLSRDTRVAYSNKNYDPNDSVLCEIGDNAPEPKYFNLDDNNDNPLLSENLQGSEELTSQKGGLYSPIQNGPHHDSLNNSEYATRALPTNAEFEQPIARALSTNYDGEKPFTGGNTHTDKTSSNVNIYDNTTEATISQPTEGRHYDGNDSLSADGSMGIRINLGQHVIERGEDPENGLIICQPSDAHRYLNNEEGLVGSVEDQHSLPLLRNNQDNQSSLGSCIPRSMTDDSAMASMYDPTYMNRDGFHLAHANNNPIYERLQGIAWVMGYHSEGRSIEVYADLDHYNVNDLQRQLVEATGEPAEKFKLRQNAQV